MLIIQTCIYDQVETQTASAATSPTRRLASDLVRQRDPPLGQPTGLLQFLRAIPPELPAQRVADAGRLTVQRQPGAARGRGAGGSGGRRRHGLPGVHVAVLALSLPQPFLSVPSLAPPAPQVEGGRRTLDCGFEDGRVTSRPTAACSPSDSCSGSQQGKGFFLVQRKEVLVLKVTL